MRGLRNRRPGWFCSLGSAVLADLELATSTIALPAQASLFTRAKMRAAFT
jgi:hypothetical protein